MKKLTSYSVTLALVAIAMLISITAQTKASAPNPAAGLQQTGFSYDTVNQIHYIDMMWYKGLVTESEPAATGYYIYRSMYGHNNEYDEFELVGTKIVEDDSAFVKYTDQVPVQAPYEYYVKAFNGEEVSEMCTPAICFSFGRYCVDLNDAILIFTTFPETFISFGEIYEYTAFAQHRSIRVQGLVRYELLEFPEGMTIDDETGELSWTAPSDASGNYYVKLRAWSLDDASAEAIQEWYIRIADDYDQKVIYASVEDEISYNLNIFPNPTMDLITIQLDETSDFTENLNVKIFDFLGNEVLNQRVSTSNNSCQINLNSLISGTYFIKVGNTVKRFVKI